MLSRRNAIFAAAGTIAVSAHRPLSAAPDSRDHVSTLTETHGPDGATVVSRQTAERCLECHAVCGRPDLPTAVAILAADCRDLCMVTATVLSRRGPLAPAICQSCADACLRLVAACQNQPLTAAVRECQHAAQVCANACRYTVRTA